MEALLSAARERGEKGDRVEILLAGLEALLSSAPDTSLDSNAPPIGDSNRSDQPLGSDLQHVVP
jgi:hypothetical protein